jgi:DNA-directed RNA polymerase specialized sigma24 family protein
MREPSAASFPPRTAQPPLDTPPREQQDAGTPAGRGSRVCCLREGAMRFSKIASQRAHALYLGTVAASPSVAAPAWEEFPEIDPPPEMVCYRSQALAIVRHFFELSSQVGRLPSLLGREFFRARVSHHAIPSFEDQIVFARDVELCLARLNDNHSDVLTLVGLYNFSNEEVAEMLHRSRSVIHECFAAALDAIAEIFLEAGLLVADRPDRRQRQISRSDAPSLTGLPGKKPPSSVQVLHARELNAG